MSEKLFLWNVRGINTSDKHNNFRRWLSILHFSLGALFEILIKESSLPSILNSLCPNWSFATNHLSDPGGRIILIWKPHLNVTIIHQSRQSMTCRVDSLSTDALYFTAVYAANTDEERNDLWIELLDIQSSFFLENQPWLVGGDFNEITHPA